MSLRLDEPSGASEAPKKKPAAAKPTSATAENKAYKYRYSDGKFGVKRGGKEQCTARRPRCATFCV